MGLSHAVRRHPHGRDEDRLVVVPVAGGLVVAVTDGAGGAPGGREAAELVVREVESWAHRLRAVADITALLVAADDLCERAPNAGEATAVVIVISDDGTIFGASCGDSEAWIVGDGVIKLTEAQHRKRRVGSGRALPVAFAAKLGANAALVVGSDGLFGYAAADVIAACVTTGADIEAEAQALLDAALGPPIRLADDFIVVVVRPAR